MKKDRISLSIDASAHKSLTDLQQRTNSKSFVEVVRKSLALYDYVVNAQENDGQLYIIDKNGDKEKITFL